MIYLVAIIVAAALGWRLGYRAAERSRLPVDCAACRRDTVQCDLEQYHARHAAACAECWWRAAGLEIERVCEEAA